MAYFPNGSSFAEWQADYCTDCVNYRDNGTGSYGCAITDAHFLLADKMHDKRGRRTAVSATLDHFIPDDGAYAKCKMRLTKEMIEADVSAEQHQIDLERYLAAMAETKAA